ncbi:hypothetical protein KGM_205160 [Danaus plexippus plexippus]|uniref:Uncharacterized protein n=1 Tax=Danaus plexippus plexippus TaxID=278856 RepID=A0A212EY26_DANPL|nr:hypothetical protein KGM_205160 [Danaus plexippus plexippus]
MVIALSLVLDTETLRAQRALLSLQPCGNRSLIYLIDTPVSTTSLHSTYTITSTGAVCGRIEMLSSRTKVGGVVRLSPTGNLIPGCGRGGSRRKLDKRAHPLPSLAPQNLAPRALAAHFRPPPPSTTPFACENSGRPLRVRGSFSMAAFHS